MGVSLGDPIGRRGVSGPHDHIGVRSVESGSYAPVQVEPVIKGTDIKIDMRKELVVETNLIEIHVPFPIGFLDREEQDLKNQVGSFCKSVENR